MLLKKKVRAFSILTSFGGMCQSGELLGRVGHTVNPQFWALGLHESSVLVVKLTNGLAQRAVFSHFPSAFFFFHSASLSVTRHSESKWHKWRPQLSPRARRRGKQISDDNIHEHEAENPLRSHTDNPPGYPTQRGFWEAGGGEGGGGLSVLERIDCVSSVNSFALSA